MKFMILVTNINLIEDYLIENQQQLKDFEIL